MKVEPFKSATHNIYLYLRAIGPGAQFRGTDIVQMAYGHSLSALRLLRKLRARGIINYKCIDQNRSIYRLTWIKREGSK